MATEQLMRQLVWLSTAFFFATTATAEPQSLPTAVGKPPATAKAIVTDTYHGEAVSDDYRWLETGSDSAVQQWSASQNDYTRSVLDHLPEVDAIRAQVTEILSSTTINYSSVTHRNGRFFAVKRQPPKQQPFLIVIDSRKALDAGHMTAQWLSADQVKAARVVVDPNEIDPSGSTSIDWYKVSPDGKMLAVSLSAGGSEIGDLVLYDVQTAQVVGEKIAGVNSGTAGGSVAWLPDSSGFYYTKHFKVVPGKSADQSVYQHVYLHQLGTDESADRYELGKGFPQIAEIQLEMDETGGHLLASVQEGDGGEFAHYLRNRDGSWRQFSSFGDGTKQAVFGKHGELLVVTLAGAPRGRIVRVGIETLDVAAAPTLVPENDDTIVTSGVAFWGETTVLPAEDRIYVVYQLGGPSQLRAFDYSGKQLAAPNQLEISAIYGLIPIGDNAILFGNTSYTEPDAYYRYDTTTEATTKTAIASSSPISLAGARVMRRFATSKDGTQVPINIMLPAGVTADGTNPCVVYGYGGYGVNMVPRFKPLNRILMDRKVIYAVTNLRGGGEYGEPWHLAGNLTHKQNVFDDFAACVRYITESGYSMPAKTGLLGGSNGGLLMGATLTQHPELMKAVVSHVGIYDMLRVELSPNGAFNVTEFGTVKNPGHFKALRAYSPYHNVHDDTKYPAVLFMTGENDPRVDPMQSRKMTARLQHATASSEPILLRTSANAGHGRSNSLSEQIEQAVDQYAFFFDKLGVQ